MGDAVVDVESAFSSAINLSLQDFIHKSLKDEQKECIRRIICLNEDVLAVRPTGFGKSVIYQLILKVLENMQSPTSGNSKTSVAVVSPLEYIRKQQVANLQTADCGVNAAAIGESGEIDKEIEVGNYNIVYGSVERWLSDRWRKSLQSGSLHQTKVLVVDEVHIN